MITLKTLPQATKEEVFEQVKNHLLKQNERSLYEESCKYKSGELKCAAGCLIADDEYNKVREGLTWNDLVRDGVAPETHQKLIYDLQLIHDEYYPHEWKEQLDKIDLNDY